MAAEGVFLPFLVNHRVKFTLSPKPTRTSWKGRFGLRLPSSTQTWLLENALEAQDSLLGNM